MYRHQRGTHAPISNPTHRQLGRGGTRGSAQVPYHRYQRQYHPPPQGARQSPQYAAHHPPPQRARQPPHGTRQPPAQGMQPRDQGSPRRCFICSYTQPYPQPQIPIDHRHFSSLRLRELTGVEETNARYLCPSCKTRHLPYPDPRIKVIVTDSTLHQFYAPPGYNATQQYDGDIMHVDYISIPGASIDTLTHAFRLDYVEKVHQKSLDVVLVASYNDIVMGYSRHKIMESFTRFADYVKMAGIHHGKTNTVAVSNLMYAPQLSWFPDNGPLPHNHQGNQVEKIDWLNQAILSLNLDNNITEYHRLHKYGVRDYTRKETDQYGQVQLRKIKCHRFEHWRELDRAQKLHLTNKQRFKMGAAINKYFVQRTQQQAPAQEAPAQQAHAPAQQVPAQQK